MKELFEGKDFSAAHLAVIEQANEIIDTYRAQGFDLTVRQLYYQFVARDLIPNTAQSYKRIASIIKWGRLAGLIDWFAIVDRTRGLRGNQHWESPGSIINGCAYSFKFDKWDDQETRVEVWIEKDALTGVIAPACNELDIDYFACRGYNSLSEQWAAGKRFSRYVRAGQRVVILHFGDHDPSGIDMTRDNDEQTNLFTVGNVTMERVALNMDQIEQYNPPANFAKSSDSRHSRYVEVYGEDSWELDALEPSVIDQLIREHVAEYRDQDLWDEAVEREDEAKATLQKMADRFDDVQAFLAD